MPYFETFLAVIFGSKSFDSFSQTPYCYNSLTSDTVNHTEQ
mgnify:CR=1 FL=1